MNDTQDPQDIERRVRHTLHTVAQTVTEDAFATTARPADTRKPHRRRRIALGVGAIAVPLALAASAFVHDGPEYVDTIPPERIVMTGSVDGSDYLLVETDRTDRCGNPIPGVELVEESKNLVGSEWNTHGSAYGDKTSDSCDSIDTSRYLKNPALFNGGGALLGDWFVFVYAVHPDVTAVRITSGGHTEDLRPYEVDGAGYAVAEIPPDMDEYTFELVIDGQVVPGSEQERMVRRP